MHLGITVTVLCLLFLWFVGCGHLKITNKVQSKNQPGQPEIQQDGGGKAMIASRSQESKREKVIRQDNKRIARLGSITSPSTCSTITTPRLTHFKRKHRSTSSRPRCNNRGYDGYVDSYDSDRWDTSSCGTTDCNDYTECNHVHYHYPPGYGNMQYEYDYRSTLPYYPICGDYARKYCDTYYPYLNKDFCQLETYKECIDRLDPKYKYDLRLPVTPPLSLAY